MRGTMRWSEIDNDALRAACSPTELPLSDVPADMYVVIQYSDAPPSIERAGDVLGMPRFFGFPTAKAHEIVRARKEQF